MGDHFQVSQNSFLSFKSQTLDRYEIHSMNWCKVDAILFAKFVNYNCIMPMQRTRVQSGTSDLMQKIPNRILPYRLIDWIKVFVCVKKIYNFNETKMKTSRNTKTKFGLAVPSRFGPPKTETSRNNKIQTLKLARAF